MIRFWCECGRQVQASAKDAGQVAVCPLCRRQMTVPQGDQPRHGPAAVSPGSQQFTGQARTTSDLLHPAVPQDQARPELASRHRGRKMAVWGLLGALAVLLLVLVPLVVQRKRPSTGAVTGVVLYNGKPLPGGIVTLHSANDVDFCALISVNGRYAIRSVPKGEMKVTIDTESLKPRLGKDVHSMPRYVPIPRKYADPTTTPLTLAVKPGRQHVDFDLTD